jgi:hypothetical protein
MTRQRLFLFALVSIFLMGAALRLVFVRDYLMFQGDQGRDALIAKRILYDGDLVLVGPVTSVGNMYLGPFYYYFMVPWLALTYPDPVGPAYGVALVSILGLILFYNVSRMIFSKQLSLIALMLMTFSHIGIQYNRFSWNPNLAPAVMTALLYSLFQATIFGKYRYWWGVAAAMALLIQLHYLALLALPAILLIYGFELYRLRRPQQLINAGLIGLVILCLSVTPLIAFDLRHNNLIRESFVGFFTSAEEHIKPLSKVTQITRVIDDRAVHILSRLVGWPQNESVERLIVLITLAAAGFMLVYFYRSKSSFFRPFMMIMVFIFIAIAGTAVYSSSVFDHYLLYLLPVLSLMYTGIFAGALTLSPRIMRWPIAIIMSLLLWFHSQQFPPLSPSYSQLDRFRQVAEDTLIHKPAGDYNIVLLSTTKDYKGMNYRYFFETSMQQPLPDDQYTDLDILVVIDELNIADPLEVPIYEIQASGKKQLIYRFETVENTHVYLYSTRSLRELL